MKNKLIAAAVFLVFAVVVVQQLGHGTQKQRFASDLARLVHDRASLGDDGFREKIVFQAHVQGIELTEDDVELIRDERVGTIHVEVRYVLNRRVLFLSLPEEVVARAMTLDTGD